MVVFQSLTLEDLTKILRSYGDPQPTRAGRDESSDALDRRAKYRAKQIFVWVYRRHVTDWDAMSDLSKGLREWLKSTVSVLTLKEKVSQQAEDGTHKVLWSLHDGKTIESVLIPAALQTDKEDFEESVTSRKAGERFAGSATNAALDSGRWGRITLCISSQVGCAMACKFCLTGIQGLDRHLKTEEIVAQVWQLRKNAPITNIVFMGMGEPLHNIDAVSKACQILLDPNGLGFSKRRVTVSTSGLVSAIDELGSRVDVSLAISLNATTDVQRSEIMPVNKKWNIEALLGACRRYPLGAHRRITFEYVLLKDFNDSNEDALRLVDLVRGIPSKINLIPFNEHTGSVYKRPSDARVYEFQRILLNRNLTATVRISRGRDILAACGQLRSLFGTARGSERHPDWKSAEPPVARPAHSLAN